MDKILIIGGAGYIGSHVNKFLNEKGYETVVYDNLSEGHAESVKWGTLVVGDLGDRAALRACFSAHRICAVMHFGAFTAVGDSVTDPERYYYNNVATTLNLLLVMREFDVQRFIFSSSCAVYGIPEFLPLTESHPLAPINPYGRTKHMVEQILSDYADAYGLRCVSLRYFNAAGAHPDGDIGEKHDPETHLIPLAISSVLRGQKALSIYGTDYTTKDGTCVRDYIHVCDLAEAHLKAMEYLNTFHQSDVFNLGNGNGYSVMDVIRSVEKVSGQKVSLHYGDRRPGDPPVLLASACKARTLLQWEPRIDNLDEIVATAWNWQCKESR